MTERAAKYWFDVSLLSGITANDLLNKPIALE